MANQLTSRKTRRRTEPRKPGGRPFQSLAKGSGAKARRDVKGLQARIDFAKEFLNWASHPPVLPPQTIAMTFNEMLADLCTKLAKISACATMEDAVDGIDDHIVLYGDQLSKDGLSHLEKQRDKLKERMKSFGC